MNNPFDYRPAEECRLAFDKLAKRLKLRSSASGGVDTDFFRELEAGKMLGVLIAADKAGRDHTLYAFSGQIGNSGFHYPGFVDPVFDYLQPDGYFKRKEREISDMSAKIREYEAGPLMAAQKEYSRASQAISDIVSRFKEKCRAAKAERKARRESGFASDAELAEMIRRSQFEKAELHRLKKKLSARLLPISQKLEEANLTLQSMKERRRYESENLQDWLFSNFMVLNAKGESKSISDIFSDTSMKIAPSGAGECCAPKLLQAAYLHGWKPIHIAEYWYGKSRNGELRIHGQYYPACRGKCLPVLRWMLQGLTIYPPLSEDNPSVPLHIPEIIFENSKFCVVNKPAGMLSVPGKGNAMSLEEWLIDKYGTRKEIKMAHRLDRDTSGLIIATFGEESYRMMQSLFATRKVKKRYIAILQGDFKTLCKPQIGRIDLPLSPDYLDRPRQKVDLQTGKDAVTDYEFISVSDNRSRIAFHPLTGRTHQLRVHAASESGLAMPIVGDPLYGSSEGHSKERMHLHAERIEFTFPPDGKFYEFESPAPF